MEIKSVSDKRLIAESELDGRKVYFLLDTGASVSLIDSSKEKKYNLLRGRKYSGALIGAGGDIESSYVCNNIFTIGNRKTSQFILSDISQVRDSIKRQTGYEILGIIGLPQLKAMSIVLDLNDGKIIME